jgi:hypothetical protein
MENIYRWTIPWLAYSNFEYKWDSQGFIEFLKDLENELVNIPEIFSTSTDNATKRLMKANSAIKEIQEKYPETKEILLKYK